MPRAPTSLLDAHPCTLHHALAAPARPPHPHHAALRRYVLPLAELGGDFYDELKSVTSGYASFDYEEGEYRWAGGWVGGRAGGRVGGWAGGWAAGWAGPLV